MLLVERLTYFDPDSLAGNWITDFVFPNAHHTPAIVVQSLVDQLRPVNVAAYLALPILLIGYRKLAFAVRTTMPETAVNEDRNPLILEDNVGVSRHVSCILAPSAKPHSCQYTRETSLKFRTSTFDRPHGLETIFGFQVVNHDSASAPVAINSVGRNRLTREAKTFSAIQVIAGTHTASPKPVRA
jgi:hypothetical protein